MIGLTATPLDIVALQQQLLLAMKQGHSGAQCSFCGTVRDDGNVTGLELEHFPKMTEHALQQLAIEAEQRWPLNDIMIVHRIGYVALGEPIVWIGVTSGHRQAAFAATEFIMDTLKTTVPLWKKIHYNDGHSEWIKAKNSDLDHAQRWS